MERFWQFLDKIGGKSHKCLARRGDAGRDARSFSADQEREAAFDTVQRGVQTVPLDRIVGSVGRYQDFDSRFRLKGYLPSEKLERIKRAMREGTPLP